MTGSKLSEEAAYRRVRAELERNGLLLMADARLPSLAGLVAGQPIRGSWWAHPAAHAIFRVASRLADDPDVLLAKLVSGKVTFVHRRLWPALLAVAHAGREWQTRRLPAGARKLLAEVRRAGRVRTDELAHAWRTRGQSLGEAARELERRLLVFSEEVHTESGAHAKVLEDWAQWARRSRPGGLRLSPATGRRRLERVVDELNRRYRAAVRLPWQAGLR